jgi:predicted nucleic acid-binding protein
VAVIRDTLGERVYIDANIVIYALEGFELYRPFLAQLSQEVSAGRCEIVTSELTLAEVLVKPLLDNKPDLIRAYQDFLTSGEVALVRISREILVQSATFRGRFASLRLPDAIHLATAVEAACSSVLTNDRRWSSFNLARVVQISSLAEA